MQCPACAADNPAENRFCDICGAPLVRCARCGALGRPGAHFCGQCGAAIGEPVALPPSPIRAASLSAPDAQSAPSASEPAPFLGRDHELATVLDLFERAKAGSGQVVCLAGDAGIGKSRLLRELRHELSLRGEAVAWLEGRCSAFAQAIPLRPVLQQLRERFAIADTDSPEEISAKLDAGLEALPELAPEAPYLRFLLSVEPEDHAIAHMDAALRRARLFEALRGVTVGSVERPPLVLVFEDLHWADRSSEEYLATAMDAVAQAPILVLATHRTGYAAPFPNSGHLTTLTLRSLSPADSVTLAGHVLGATDLPGELTAMLMDKAAGVPLRIEELSRALLAAGVLQRDDAGYRIATSIADADIPATLEGIIAARLDRLRDGAKRAVQLCSVIGPGVTKRLLARVVESPAQLDGWLGELEHQDVLDRPGRATEPVYAFTHAMIQDVAYHSLAPARRKELHRAAAAAIEELEADRLPEHSAELARHWEGAEQWAKAMEYAQRAGDQAAQIAAHSEARHDYARALSAAQHLQPPPELNQVAALLASCGRALRGLGEYDEGAAHYTRALALARQAGDRGGELDVLLGMAELFDSAHRPEEAQSCCDQAYALAGELDDRAAQAACLASRAASIAAWQGPTAEARHAARAALELAEQVNDSALRARALIVVGGILEWRADLDGCQRYLQEGAALAERSHCGRILGDALFHLGHAYLSRGRYQQALRWYDEVRGFAERANDKFWIARGPGIVAGVYLELYDTDTVIQLCLEGDEIAQRAASWPAARADCLVKLGLAHLQRGEHGAAETTLRRAWDLIETDGWTRWCWHIPLLRARAELALATGRLDEAWSYATQSRQLATQTDSRKHVARAQIVLGEIAAAQDQLPEAVQLLRGAVTLADHIHTARELWLAGGALGGALGRLGQDREAETYLTQAAQTIETIAAELTDPALRASFTRAEPVTEVYRRLGRRPLPAASAHART